MDETTLKISIASFIHDIGKFAGKEVLGLSSREVDLKASDFLPVYNGRYSHQHALFTAEFIERYKAVLPDEFNKPWGVGDGLIKLAASHHNPSSPMEWIVAEADRISSGMDRESFDAYENEAVPVSDYEKTRLLPILECLDVEGKADFSKRENYKHAFRLARMSPETMFPLPVAAVTSKNRDSAKGEYHALFNDFIRDLQTLSHKAHISLWFEHFESLVMRYVSQMPAARVGNVIPDVSLYDHLKTTAAIGAALYLFHKTANTLNVAAVKKGDIKKFLLISGNFHGIQNFIFNGYGDTRKYRSKLLRGRSFYVSVLTELVAHLVCRQISLPSVSVVLNAGGKFTIIGPNTEDAKKAVQAVQHQIDSWFSDLTYCETGISLSMVTASPDEFKSGDFPKVQDRVSRNMSEKKLSRFDLDRFAGVVENYFDRKGAELCPFCGKRPADMLMKDEKQICRLCKDHVFMGENLVKKNALAVLDRGIVPQDKMLMEPLFGEFQIVFPDSMLEEAAEKGHLIKYWKLRTDPQRHENNNAAFKFFSGYVPKYTADDRQYELILANSERDESNERLDDLIHEGAPKSMNYIAAMARTFAENGKESGVEALGVLKADVDHLGLLMACGLKDNLYSISRLATMSRQINNFFAVYLPWFLETNKQFRDIYTVFAGGDDLLLIGPWNKVVTLAPILSKEFNAYVCNKNIHLSAGISLHKAHSPVDVMAEAAGIAVERSKSADRNRMTLFDETVTWEEAEQLSTIKSTVERWLDEGYLSSSMLYRLNYLIDMASMEAKLVSDKSIPIRNMSCMRWRAFLSYTVERNVGKSVHADDRKKCIAEVREKLAEWLATWQGKLRIPLWDIQYNRRK
jgi:CRISPR-associated protein Csm1